ncbi:ABC transporter permease [Geodermatophilus sabuli]|uniref:Autoinducer 2 import system permease protein LsrD n=1 Tax=Geodermatophilus sabuli TaxID=1564158 RepID=A0A285EET7_9ACTN|nr:ABC transporter permease [Geodermatophilus sabuli]MBB3083565.1 ribose/xylose/arabinose/galactoside ABC-type transport system permease subunit [Geodermatophilus sabuli]SNX96714.1 monosaccharide ABC transporter membrane protein, CUT2 family [Geodermatophilus sabuli]
MTTGTRPVAASAPAGPSAPGGRALLRRALSLLAPLAGLAVILLLAAVTTPGFYSTGVLQLVLFQIGLIGVTAVGQTLVLLVGGIDLSIGAVIGLTTVIIAVYTRGDGARLGVAILLALAAGAVVGLVNGLLVVRRLVPAFVATFATFVLVQGVITAWTRGAPSGNIPGALSPLGTGRWLGVPVPAWVFLAVAVVAGIVLGRTGLGRRLYATGANARATALSGVRTGWIIAGCFVASALLAVLAGLINAGYIGYVDARLSRSLDLNSVAAAVIGGVGLTGGRGRIGQTVAGVVLLAVLLAWLRQLGAGAGAQLIVSGAVILLAVWLQNSGWTPRSPRRNKQRDGVR